MRKTTLLFFAALTLPNALAAQSPACCGGQYAATDTLVTVTVQLPFHAAPQSIGAAVIGDWLVVEGDIVVGSWPGKPSDSGPDGLYCNTCQLWPNSTLPYVIGPGFSAAMVNQINAAINQINSQTNLCVVPRTNQSDYIKLVPAGNCSSWVGRVGGEQIVNLDDVGDNSGCYKPAIIHELFHAAGLWHEQSREDRNSHVIINWNNILPNTASNFDQHIGDGFDLGPYDFFSIMHYGPYAFSSNGQPTITRLNGAINLGQGNDPTSLDIQSINYLYAQKCNDCDLISAAGWDLTNISETMYHFEHGGKIVQSWCTPITVGSGKFWKFDSGQSVEFIAVVDPWSCGTIDFQPGSVIEIYIDGCYGN